jgi:hypothetical protein
VCLHENSCGVPNVSSEKYFKWPIQAIRLVQSLSFGLPLSSDIPIPPANPPRHREKLTFIVSHMKFLWTFRMPFGQICQMVDILRYIRLTHALFRAPNFPSRQPYRIPEPVRENIQKPCLHKNFLWTFRVLFGKLLLSVEDA